MAQLPDVDNPEYGYFYTPVPEEIVSYIINLLSAKNESIVFNVHASAIFYNDEESKEIHMPSSGSIVLDPDMDDLVHIIENKIDLSHDPDRVEVVEGSGWSIDTRTLRYWFNVFPCQPNPTPSPTERNTSDYEDSEYGTYNSDIPEEEGIKVPPRIANTFILAIIEHEWRKDRINENSKLPRAKAAKVGTLLNYANVHRPNLHNDEAMFKKFTMQDVANWHWRWKVFNIRIFSLRGNVLYAKKMDTEDWIDMYMNSNREFALVLKLNALFQRSLNRHLCENCYTFHRDPEHCVLKIVESFTEDVHIAEYPRGRHGLVTYSDFECVLENLNPEDDPDDLEYVANHTISGWAAATVNKWEQLQEIEFQNGIDVPETQLIKNYINYLFKLAFKYCFEGVGTGRLSLDCKICGEDITDQNFVNGRNFINAEIGCYHEECWLDRKNSLFVFFHNFRGYDSHFVISKIVTTMKVMYISATSIEKLNMIVCSQSSEHGVVQITFKDTFNFFTCSLAKCVSMIEDWRYTPVSSRNAKGVFPYDWFDNIDKLNATELPPPPWKNRLTNTMQDHEAAFKEWNEHGFNNFAQYHDFYMVNDTTQLTDAFEEFRRTCLSEFNLDPVYFQGAPGYTWYLGLTSNEDLFKIITDKKIYLEIQSHIRGGVSQVMHRYANVEDKLNESIFFLDVNSLYSKCMTYKMPGRYLRKITELPDNWEQLYASGGKECGLLLVDFYYPQHLHDRDFAYPMAPHEYNDKLCTTFLPKEKYMVHSELLKFYMDRGMVLEKFHYGYIFEQDYTLRDYVQNNIEKRRHTQSEVMKTLYKLLNNSLYGKTCENVFKYREFKVLNEEYSGDMMVQKNPDLVYAKQFLSFYNNETSKWHFLSEFPPNKVKLNKPIQIGFTILEFAKREIYNFLITVIEELGSLNVLPMYTDTDSIMFLCKFPEPYKVFYNNEKIRPFLDFEKVPESWGVKTFDTDKQSGLWSPEANGKEIVEYVGLRSKTYAYRFRDNTEVLKNKGIPKSAMIADSEQTRPLDKIRLEHYKKAIMEGEQYKITHFHIGSKQHYVTTKRVYKLGLSGNDQKRTILADRQHTLPFGYAGLIFANSVVDKDDPDLFEGWRHANVVL